MRKILVIDDDLQTRLTLRVVLERSGYEIVEASDGDEGLCLFRKERVNLVITDIFMPERDGLAVIEEIRRDHPKTKIISITGSRGDDCARAKELGAVRTFVKPYEMQEILDVVEVETRDQSTWSQH